MTKVFSGEMIRELIDDLEPESVVSTNNDSVHIKSESALKIFNELKNKNKSLG